MLKKIALGVLVVVGGFLLVVATRPGKLHVERGVSIDAPPDVIRAQLVDFHKWSAWSPWDKRDPSQKTTYSGPESGVGATYHWAGNDDVGEGEMKINHVSAGKVGVDLEFIRPFPAKAKVDFLIGSAGAHGSNVTWGMEQDLNFMSKAFGVFVDMDEMLGKDFSEGLAALKKVSEAEAQKAAAPVAATPPADAPK